LIQRVDGPGLPPAGTGYATAVSEFEKGDRVTWKSHGGTAEGEVLKKITEDTEAAGRTVRASADEPQYLVRSDKSGGEAVHKPGALTKKG
jgi:Hypervirulence associated proteins TUDOR domain